MEKKKGTFCCCNWDLRSGNISIGLYEIVSGTLMFLLQLVIIFYWAEDESDPRRRSNDEEKSFMLDILMPGSTYRKLFLFHSM